MHYKKSLSGFGNFPQLSASEKNAVDTYIKTINEIQDETNKERIRKTRYSSFAELDLAYVQMLDSLGLFDYAIWWWEDERFTNKNLMPDIKDSTPRSVDPSLQNRKPSQERLDFLKKSVFDMYQAAIIDQRSGNTDNSSEYFFVSKVEAFKDYLVSSGILDPMDIGPAMDFQFQTPNAYHLISMKNERPCVYLNRIQGRILLRSPLIVDSPFNSWQDFDYTRFRKKVNELIDELNRLSRKSKADNFEDFHSDLSDLVNRFYMFRFVEKIFDMTSNSSDINTFLEDLLEDKVLAELGQTQRRKFWSWLEFSNMPIAKDCSEYYYKGAKMLLLKSAMGSLLLHLCREMFHIFYERKQITKAQRDYGFELMRTQLAILDPDYFHLCYDVYGSDVGIPRLQILKQFSLRSGKFVLKLSANNFLFMPIAMKLTLDAVRLERKEYSPLETEYDEEGNPIPKNTPIKGETWDAYQITSFVRWYSFFQIPDEDNRDEESREKLETKTHPTPEGAEKTESWAEILYDLFEGVENQVVPSSKTQNQIIRSAKNISIEKEPYKLMSAPSISILQQKLKAESDAGIFGSPQTKNILLVCGGLLALGGVVYFASKKYKARAKAKALKRKQYYR